jgi:hypothetical protein
MNELSAADKAVVADALLRLVGEDVLTPLEKRDILNEITRQLTGFNIADLVAGTNNRRRLLLKSVSAADEYEGIPRELVFDGTETTIRIFGEQPEDDIVIGAAPEIPDIDPDALLAGMDYVTESGGNAVGWWRKYKSGWAEQGGTTTAAATSLAFPLAMEDTGYHWFAVKALSTTPVGQYIYSAAKSATGLTGLGFTFTNQNTQTQFGNWDTGVYWEVKGMAA